MFVISHDAVQKMASNLGDVPWIEHVYKINVCAELIKDS